MEITNELLAAYAEGNVTPEERKAVREYLTEHPSQLESVMIMMDEDFDMEVKPQKKGISFMGSRIPKLRDLSIAGAALIPSYSQISFDKMAASTCAGSMCADSASFDERLSDLLDEIS
jgi:hypothetical protein